MNVFQVMSTPVMVVYKSDAIEKVRDVLSQNGIHAMPVVDAKNELAGIISSSDVVSVSDSGLTAGDLMTNKIHIATPNNRVEDAAKVMLKHSVHHLVVMEEGKIVGMISSLDLLKALLPD